PNRHRVCPQFGFCTEIGSPASETVCLVDVPALVVVNCIWTLSSAPVYRFASRSSKVNFQVPAAAEPTKLLVSPPLPEKTVERPEHRFNPRSIRTTDCPEGDVSTILWSFSHCVRYSKETFHAEIVPGSANPNVATNSPGLTS